MKTLIVMLLTTDLMAWVSLAKAAESDNTGAGKPPAAFKLLQTIVLPGVRGRFDHFAVDAKGHRLFVAALGNNTLEVVDIAAGKHLKSIAGLHKPTGVLYLANRNQVGVANGDDGTFRLLDGVSYDTVKSLGSLDDADNVRFDPTAGTIYVGYGAGALAIIDAATMTQTGSIKLPAHPESFQLESGGVRIFVNVPDAQQVAVIDREKQSVTAAWPMTEFQANFPMALDDANHRLFIGCREPARLVVFDTTTAKLVTSVAISKDADDLFYDATRKRLYLSCGEGYLDVVSQRDADHYERIERVPTGLAPAPVSIRPSLTASGSPYRSEAGSPPRFAPINPSRRLPLEVSHSDGSSGGCLVRGRDTCQQMAAGRPHPFSARRSSVPGRRNGHCRSGLAQGGLAAASREDRKNRVRLCGAVVVGGVLGPILLLGTPPGICGVRLALAEPRARGHRRAWPSSFEIVWAPAAGLVSCCLWRPLLFCRRLPVLPDWVPAALSCSRVSAGVSTTI